MTCQNLELLKSALTDMVEAVDHASKLKEGADDYIAQSFYLLGLDLRDFQASPLLKGLVTKASVNTGIDEDSIIVVKDREDILFYEEGGKTCLRLLLDSRKLKEMLVESELLSALEE